MVGDNMVGDNMVGDNMAGDNNYIEGDRWIAVEIKGINEISFPSGWPAVRRASRDSRPSSKAIN
jgi:hypothetical protein